jgi:hypothetical protein
MVKIISEYFSGFSKVFSKNLLSVIFGLMHSESASVASIACSLSQKNRQAFKAK